MLVVKDQKEGSGLHASVRFFPSDRPLSEKLLIVIL